MIPRLRIKQQDNDIDIQIKIHKLLCWNLNNSAGESNKRESDVIIVDKEASTDYSLVVTNSSKSMKLQTTVRLSGLRNCYIKNDW